MIDDPDPVQTFDLPDECELDHVVIYPNDAPEEPAFEAVPFVHRKTFEDGQRWLHEPADFTVTDQYREAVADHADVELDDLLLERNIPTHTTPEPL